jgi:hypothetical protein
MEVTHGTSTMCTVTALVHLMTADVGHVLLTRFNLPTHGHESLVRAKANWLHDRTQLFDRYCHPSVAAQTDQNFSWVIYFDPESPEWLMNWIRAHEAAGHFTPLFREQVPREVLLADIEEVLGRRPNWLITSNLDNDDSIAVDFVERVKSAPTKGSRTAVYLADGLIRRDGKLYRHHYPLNPFCSVVETWDAPVTAWNYWHISLPDHMPATILRGGPGWLQVVHGANVSNRVRGRLTRTAQHRSAFPGLLEDLDEPSPTARIADALVAVPMRAVREGGRAAAKAAITRVGGREAVNQARTVLAGARRSAGR